jgi:hypothetical protein
MKEMLQLPQKRDLMKGLTKRLSLSSVQRGSKGGTVGEAAEEAAAYEKVLQRLAKGVEKAAGRLEDKQTGDVGEAAAGALQDAGEAGAELAAQLQRLAAFQSDMRGLTQELRTALERGTLGPLKAGATRPSLREVRPGMCCVLLTVLV